jgi:hypothetical protein
MKSIFWFAKPKKAAPKDIVIQCVDLQALQAIQQAQQHLNDDMEHERIKRLLQRRDI